MADKIKIIIADDHPIFRSGLKQIIAEDPGILIAGEAGDGEQALMLIKELSPDIAILDVDMPKINGLEVLNETVKSQKNTKVVFLTAYNQEDMFNEAMDRGIMGYVLKESALNDIIECINLVHLGKHYISPLISDLLINRGSKKSDLEAKQPGLKNLTSTEKRILKMISSNMTSKEISDKLFISYRTVENHRSNIISKLNLKGSHSLLKFAIENKSAL